MSFLPCVFAWLFVMLVLLYKTHKKLKWIRWQRARYLNLPENQTKEGKARIERERFRTALALLVGGTVAFVAYKYVTTR